MLSRSLVSTGICMLFFVRSVVGFSTHNPLLVLKCNGESLSVRKRVCLRTLGLRVVELHVGWLQYVVILVNIWPFTALTWLRALASIVYFRDILSTRSSDRGQFIHLINRLKSIYSLDQPIEVNLFCWSADWGLNPHTIVFCLINEMLIKMMKIRFT